MDINKILPLVQRPTRYINHELNSVRKEKAEVSLALCFPDMYELGASNLGLEILYHIVNARQDAVAERCYAPATDMEAMLRKENYPLFSLETKKPLKEFDVIGFGLQYELCATNVLNMLNLGGLKLLSSERTEAFPLVIGGGPLTANPEPLADFFDAFVLGDGEDAINEIVDAVKKLKQKAAGKTQLLEELSKIEGVYVPSLYAVNYKSDGTIESVKPRGSAPEKIVKRTVKLQDSFFPAAQMVPYLQTVHNRLNIEIARGCPRRCRFCQASRYYYPWRIRPREKIMSLLEQGLAATGYEEVALSSLTCTEYKGLDGLLDEINYKYGAGRLNVSIPSLRCDQFSLKVASNLGHNKRSSLTFAPEAGSQRLREVIGKELTEADISGTLTMAYKMGWRLIKLYFMLGLQTENDSDVSAIVELVRSVKRQAQGLNFNITLSPFVPKAQTPFQWSAMATKEVLKERITRLEKQLPASVKSHNIDSSILEAVFARGDRKLSKAIVRAWEKGCKFDQWKEHMKFGVWNEAFAETGIDTAFYLGRERGRGEVLPWDHLVFASDKNALIEEHDRGMAACEAAEKVSAPEPAAAPVSAQRPVPVAAPQGKTVSRVRLRFSRKGETRFLSHLEQIEVFRRAIRRAGLPLVFTSGFHPQPKAAFGPAISVGYESQSEYMELDLFRRVELPEITQMLNNVLPPDFELIEVKRVPLFFPSFDSLVNVAEYRIQYSVTQEQIDALLAKSEIIIEKHKDGKVTRIDARPLIKELKIENGGLLFRIAFGPKKNVKPEKILQVLCGLDETGAKLVPITRTGLLVEKKDGTISVP